jgi:TolA protein
MPPVYTVKLFEAARAPQPKPVQPSKPAPKKKTAPKPKPPEEAGKKPVAKAPEPKKAAEPKPAPKKVVSLKPKATEKKPKPKPKPAEKKPARDTEKLLAQRLKTMEQRVQEKRAEAKLSQRLQALQDKVKDKGTKAAGGASAASGSLDQDEALRLYAGQIMDAVRSNWMLPEQLLDKPGLVCVVVFRIENNGTVMNARFEQTSGHTLFDQSALRAVQAASPLPPLPAALRPGPMETGLRFRPSGIGM